MADSSLRWRPRYRLSSLLWLMLCVALTIGMYRYGYQTGHSDALNQRTFVGNLHPRVYEVASIVPMKPGTGGGIVADFNVLMSDLKKEVLPHTWDDKGGATTMAEFPTNLSLVVSHDEDGHERIGNWIRQRRERAENSNAGVATTSPQQAASR